MPRDNNPKLTKEYARGKAIAELQYGEGKAEKALRNGWQYENSEKNHHKRGVPVRTDSRAQGILDHLTKSKKYP